VTRRPASRRPPKLQEHSSELVSTNEPQPAREPGPRELLKRNRVSGCAHPRLGRDEVRALARRVAAADPRHALGLDLGSVDIDDVYSTLESHWGCALDDPRARLDVDLTIERLERATERLVEVASTGGRLIFATSRPASLLGVHLTLSRAARDAGGVVLSEREVTAVRAAGRPDRSIWWIDGIAVVTDGTDLVGHDDTGVWSEIDFAVGRAELVVTDGVLAAGALAARFEVVALADLPVMALGVAADRGGPVTIVPAVSERPAWCYEPLLTLASQKARSTSSVS